MGNLQFRGGSRRNKDEDRCQAQFYNRLIHAHSSQLLHECSFGKWLRNRKVVCGFTDKTDYSTLRESHWRSGILVKPDTTDGRYFTVSWKNKSEIMIIEKIAWWVGSIKVPRILIGGENSWWFGNTHHSRTRKMCSVIGYRDGLAVVQINHDRHFTNAKMYFLDLARKTCLGYCVIMYHTQRWYECYISPNKRRILLRPDHLTRIVVLPDNYSIQNIKTYCSESEAPEVETVLPQFRTHALTFNSKLGDDYIIMGSEKDIEVRSLSDWTVLRHAQNLNLTANIHQIRSSPQGDFIAARCISPIHSREYSTNYVAVLSYPKFEILMQLNVRGCYWPVSEVINLQVFPKFSPSESCIAVMRNCSYKRKVFVYKLPPVMSSLQHLCRKAILQLTTLKDTEKLPLPSKLLDFLQFKQKLSECV